MAAASAEISFLSISGSSTTALLPQLKTQFFTSCNPATSASRIIEPSFRLYSDSAKKSPDKPRTHLNLGVAMGRDRNLERESIEVFEKVIGLGKLKKERYLQAVNNIVVAYVNLGESQEAITQGEKYLEEAPDYVRGLDYPRLMYNLAYAYHNTGQYSEAMQALASGITKERRRRNGYIVALMAETLTAAYDNEAYRDKTITESYTSEIFSSSSSF